MDKAITATQAASLIKNGDTVATGGFVGIGVPEEILLAIENRYLSEKAPQNLTLLFAAGQGDGKERGLNHLGHEGLLSRVIGGHYGLAPKIQKLAVENKIIAYNLPQGVISHMYRDISSKRPRTITHVGLGTFVDPRISGGKINPLTTEDIVELIEFDGQEYLAYKTLPINVSIIRGTTADAKGNIRMEREALILESLALASAAKNSGGIVIAQVENMSLEGGFHPKEVNVPGILVDYIVVAKPENHLQTFAEEYNPAYSGEKKIALDNLPKMELNNRKIMARRAAFELVGHYIVNLGFGVPEGISLVANEEEIMDHFVLTAEPGLVGGLPAGGLSFGAGANPDAIIDQPAQFDFYDGGGLDITFLGLAQADRDGNLNVSKFGTRLAGAGGFINISQNAKKVVFMGTFTTGGLKTSISKGKLTINQEGKVKKFVEDVEHITFSGNYANKHNQDVVYITERCVFELTSKGLLLTEVAPGIDVQSQILDLMDFTPEISENLKEMDPRIFRDDVMGLSKEF